MSEKTKTYGIKPKVRSIDEVNSDYNNQAAQAGHKTRIVMQLQAEIEKHLERLCEINEEASKLPKEPPKEEVKPEVFEAEEPSPELKSGAV